ncbi:MAG: hypothetical protein ABIK18_02240, partial [candidate division WOR-3 bacterium]
MAETYLFALLVKRDIQALFSLLFGSELRIKLKAIPENLFRPFLTTIPPFDFPFELKQDFNLKLNNKSKTFSTKDFT